MAVGELRPIGESVGKGHPRVAFPLLSPCVVEHTQLSGDTAGNEPVTLGIEGEIEHH